MKERNKNIQRVAALVKEYWRLRDAGRTEEASRWYQKRREDLQEEIGEDAYEEATYEYEEEAYWVAECRWAAQHDENYR